MSEIIPQESLTRISELTKRKKSLMEEIYSTTTLQSGLLTPDKMENLLTVTERKQEYINEFSLIEVEVLPLEKEFLNLHNISSWDDAPEEANEKWREISSLRRQTVSLANETRRVEADNIAKIGAEYQKLKKDMAMLHINKGSAKAYRGNGRQSEGFFVDNKY